MTGSRPGGVTLVSILAWISGLIAIIGGVLAFFTVHFLIAVISMALGLITVAVGAGLWRGRNAARVIATIVFILDIAYAVYAIKTNTASFWPELVAGLFAFIGLVFLYTRAANTFFKR